MNFVFGVLYARLRYFLHLLLTLNMNIASLVFSIDRAMTKFEHACRNFRNCRIEMNFRLIGMSLYDNT